MNDCFLNLLFSFQLLLPLKEGADFVGSKQTIDVILSDLSLLGYVIPVGGLGIGLFICLLAYLAAEYNVRFQSHEKYKIAMNMLHSIHMAAFRSGKPRRTDSSHPPQPARYKPFPFSYLVFFQISVTSSFKLYTNPTR